MGETTYSVFARDWWRDAEQGEYGYPDNLVPYPGAPVTVLYEDIETEEEAREVAQTYNHNNDPGRYSRKAEYMRGSASDNYADRLED